MDFEHLCSERFSSSEIELAGIVSVTTLSSWRARSVLPLLPDEARAGKPTLFRLSEVYGVGLMSAYVRNAKLAPTVAIEWARRLMTEATDDDHAFLWQSGGSDVPATERVRAIITHRDQHKPWISIAFQPFAEPHDPPKYIFGFEDLSHTISGHNGFSFVVTNLTELFSTVDRALGFVLRRRDEMADEDSGTAVWRAARD